MQKKKLFLLDAMALLYRAHFAFIKNPRITSTGLNTSAVFGFTNSLLELIQKERPTHMAVAFDPQTPTFRHIEYTEYKAQREEMPEDISSAIPMVKRLLSALNIPALLVDGYEADDVIGTIAKATEKLGFEVFMVTPDKDFAQLVTENIFLYKPSRQGNGIEIYNPEQVKQRYGILPDLVPDFLGLKGDASDNIPGIPKIGDKTAIDLINEFGALEEIIRRANEIKKSSVKESIVQFADQGLLSKRLATINIEVPVEWTKELLELKTPNTEALTTLFKELEFRNLAERVFKSNLYGTQADVQTDLFGNVTAVQPVLETSTVTIEEIDFETLEKVQYDYRKVESDSEVDALIAEIKQKKHFCFDTETDGLNPMQANMLCITISVEARKAYYIPFKKDCPNIKKLQEVFLDETIEKIGQNLKFDILVLKQHGIEVKGPVYDTMLAHYILNPEGKHGMDALAMEYLKYSPISITTLIGKKGKGQLSMTSVEEGKMIDYACEDADITYQLKEKLHSKLESSEVKSVYHDIEMPLMGVLADMEYHGVKIDENILHEYSAELGQQINGIEKTIYEMAGVKFNINSPRQLGELLFDHLKLGKPKKTKTGQYVTNEEALTYLANEHDLPAFILKYRQLSKLKSTYVDALPLLVHPVTQRIHTTYSQAVAATGRLSSNNPNLQNIPIRSDEGKEVRKVFVAGSDDFVIVSADYSQVELRLIAELSKDPGMMEAFCNDIDIHTATAAKVFGVPVELVNSDMRAKAKMVNFGIIYGISAFGLSQRLKIPRTEAKEIIDAYFTQYAGVKTYMDSSIESARKKGYTETIMGRRRHLPDINSGNATIRGFAERNAINAPVQGSAADLIKIAMINIHKEFKDRKLISRMIMQVHDELVFEVHHSELDMVKELVKEKMESAIKLNVPMVVEVGSGKNWLEAH